jgi:hypothetical protein
MNEENVRTVYQQDYESVRYQDNLRWARFKTISVIEGAFLYATYGSALSPVEALLITILGSILVLIVSLLAVKDGLDVESHFERIHILETTMMIPPFNARQLLWKIRGKHLTKIALIIINLFNILVIIKRSMMC